MRRKQRGWRGSILGLEGHFARWRQRGATIVSKRTGGIHFCTLYMQEVLSPSSLHWGGKGGLQY